MGRPPLRLGRPKGRPQAPFQPSHENRYPFTNWSTFAPPKWSKFTPPLTQAADFRGHARRASEADTRAEQDEEDPIAFRAKINGQGDEAVLLLIKLRDRFIGL